MAEAIATDQLLEGLNEPQRQAVEHGEGPLLVLAGAGSGKTRVLTHRIAYLIGTGQARADEILAITFTNKAANEMRERVELLVGRATRAMWVMTFHSACARILRADAHRLGYTRSFTIYDAADQRRLIKQCLTELDVDAKRFTPRAMQAQISDAKNKLRDAEAYRQIVGSYFEQTVADVYEEYERQLHQRNAMDFDDLMVRAVNVLELFQEVRDRYQNAFRFVMVDEYQDTNHAQYRLLQLLSGERRNVMVVGDDDQCLVAGTPVTMADGSIRPIESITVGDDVLAWHGEGFGPAAVVRTAASRRTAGVEVSTAGGRRLVSTPEHVHFADVRETVALTVSRIAVAERVGLKQRPASSVLPGMLMRSVDGFDLVTEVRSITLDTTVHDIDVESVHNFVAGGLVTHNSVYGFRGADIRNILDFEEDYVDAVTIRLEQNYRSTQMILDAANAVIENNRGRMGKTLWTDVGVGDKVKVRDLDDEHAEARFVAGEIERLVDEGVSRSEVAVFYRTNAQSRVLQDVLTRNNVDFQVVGGPKFYERSEVKDAVAYLNFLVNPQDGGAFTRIVNSPKRGLGQTSVSRVLAHANTMGLTPWEAAAEPDKVPNLGKAAIKGFDRFMSTMHRLKERVDENPPVATVLREMLTEVGYLDALEAERTIEAQGRIENLEALGTAAEEYDTRAGEEGSVAGWLEQLSLVAAADELEDDEGTVTLMTLHIAKGLEYPIVFIIGAEDGVFPHSRAIDEGDVEEERRLAYVGITRAMRDLYITWARRRTTYGQGSMPGLPSRFLQEIPDDLKDQAPRQRVGAFAPRGRAMTSWASAAAAAGEIAEPSVEFRIGDDVVHAAFGDGVVTGMQPGDVITVRFADGMEKSLMASLAPIKKR